MKIRIISLLLIALLLFTGCNAVSEEPSEATPEVTEPTEKPTEQKPTARPTEKDDSSNDDNNDIDNEENNNNSNDQGNENNSNDQGNENDSNDQENENNSNDQENEDDGILKILTIGNSFSDDTKKYAYQIAKELGYEQIKLGNLFIGGCSLDKHATNAKGDKAAYRYDVNTSGTWTDTPNYKMSDALKSENWDFVSLQQASAGSGLESTYSQLEYMIGYVKSFVPNAKIVWNMTWSYPEGSDNAGFPNYDNDQLGMYESIVSTVKNKVLTKEDIVAIIPNGTAIQNARTSYIGDNLNRDNCHLSVLGRYIAGLTFMSVITGKSVENITYKPSDVDADMQKVAIESAMNAIAEPWEVTESEYPAEPAFDLTQYNVLDMDWTEFGYWRSNETKHHEIRTDVSGTSEKFYASKMFTKEELPVGSVIVLQEGWKYRPEAWKDSNKQTSRPAETTTAMITIDEAWWGDYVNRAFNVSKADGTSLVGVPAEQVEAALIIYVPKS